VNKVQLDIRTGHAQTVDKARRSTRALHAHTRSATA